MSCVYVAVYVLAVALSVRVPMDAFLLVADLSMGLMSLINIPAMFILRRKIKPT